MSLKITMAGATDTGRVRKHNEDAIGWNEACGLAVVADGVGGHQAGEVASTLVVDHLLEALAEAEANPHACAEALRAAIAEANRALHAHARESHREGMATTVVALRVCGDGDKLAVAHVGDSRLYRLRNGVMQQLTVDHSLVQELIDNGSMTPEEAAVSSRRNLITRSLGLEDEVAVDMLLTSVRPGDGYLLCSDGLSDRLTDLGMGMMLEQGSGGPLQAVADKLVETANAAGGQDNIAVVLLRAETDE